MKTALAQSNTTEPFIILAPITEVDIPGYIDMKKRSWLDTYPNDECGISYQMIQEYTSRKSDQQKLVDISSQLQNGERLSNFILHVDGIVAGAVAYQVHPDGLGQIRELYLAPEYIGKSFGKILIGRAFDELLKSNVSDIRVEAVEYNTRAIRFYEKCGFVKEANIEPRFEVAEGVFLPEIMMRKIVSDE
jgi:ribosomal protein S18 acetylase RimI-like enzyme